MKDQVKRFGDATADWYHCIVVRLAKGGQGYRPMAADGGRRCGKALPLRCDSHRQAPPALVIVE